ncbi:MAG: superoxide dismutase, partial [Planctomycetota bacterium]
MPYSLPDLPYAFDALQPHIDAKTMEIHHGKHHAAYIAKVNDALADTDHANTSIEEVVASIDKLPEGKQGPVRNNGGGHLNHLMFWTGMSPEGGGTPSGDLAAAIDRDLGGFDSFKQSFANAGATRFGSGWAWLTTDSSGKLSVSSTANQDNPL